MFTLLPALLLFLLPLAYSPGPGNMFFAANGARFGFQATIPSNVGYHIATWLVTFAIGFGFGHLLQQFPAFMVAIRYLGSAYVLYLAWKIAQAGYYENSEKAQAASFWDGVLLLLLNAKAYVIIGLMFSQFLTDSPENLFGQIVLITTYFTLNNAIAFSLWAFVGDRIASFFCSQENAQKLNVFFGGMLALVAIWMIWPE